jgi:hypothetical protein
MNMWQGGSYMSRSSPVWGGMRDGLYLVTNVSGQSIGTISKGQAVQGNDP